MHFKKDLKLTRGWHLIFLDFQIIRDITELVWGSHEGISLFYVLLPNSQVAESRAFYYLSPLSPHTFLSDNMHISA